MNENHGSLADAAIASGAPRLTRRAACSLGAGLSTAALLGLPASRGLAAERHDIRYVLTDQRYPESLEFGAVLAREGSQKLEVTSGLTRLWQDVLVPLWRGKTGTIAGLTQYGTWICIAEQARSCRRRSVLVGRHGPTLDAAATEHVLSAPPPVLTDAVVLRDCGDMWPSVMARLAAGCPTNPRPTADERFRSPDAATAAPSAHLVSWIIA